MVSANEQDQDEQDQDWQSLLAGIQQGDELACQKFWSTYGPMIERVAQRHLGPGMQRRVGPESIMLSACRTFIRRTQAGAFTFDDAESIWHLLCAITVNKVRNNTRFHLRQKRRMASESSGEALADVPVTHPGPEDEVEFAEQFEYLLEQFDDEEKQILELRLQDQTQAAIAQQLGCSERTVRRLMKRMQDRMLQILSRDDD